MKSAPLVSLLGVALLLLSACSEKDTPAGAADEPGDGATATSTTRPRDQATPAETPPPKDTPTAAPTVVGPAAHDGERTLDHIRALSEGIGTRVSGTDGEERAVDYIREQFAANGYTVEVQEFAFRDRGFIPETLLVGEERVSSRQLTGSAQATVSGEAVYVGLADEAGLAGKDLDGAIAIADRGTLTFDDKAAAVEAKGAIALIVINTEDGLFNGRLSSQTDIVALGVGHESADQLLEAAEDGETISIDVPEAMAKNVIARPSDDAACDLVVGGHHDSVPDVPGASDNASGTAAVLELSRAFAADGLDEGLCFVTFGAEESGLYGSQAYLEHVQEIGDEPEMMVNIDVIGTGSRVQLIGDRELTALASSIAEELEIPAERSTEPAGTSSDHATFIAAGIPAIFFATNDFSRIHTPQDSIDIIDPQLLEQAGDLAYELIARELQRLARP